MSQKTTCISKKEGTYPLKIICPAMFRSGTSSLSLALKELGYIPWHMITNPWYSQNNLSWWSYNRKKLQNKEFVDFDEFFELTKCNVVMDIPTNIYWKNLIEYYPNAKIIICTRNDFDKWKISCQKLICNVINSKIVNLMGKYT